MANPSWPSSLPQYVLEQGFGETLADQFVETQMEAGPPKSRRRFTRNNRSFSVNAAMTLDQSTIFEAFYDITCSGGALPFNWVHPRTRTAITFRWRHPVPKLTEVHGNKLVWSFALEATTDPISNYPLYADFKNQSYRQNGVILPISSFTGYSYTQAATVQIFCSDGVVRPFAANTLAIQGTGFYAYNGVTNYALQSETFDSATWTKAAATVTANAATAPDNNATADSVVESATAAAHGVNQGAMSLPGGTVIYTASVFVKRAAGTRNFQLQATDTGGTNGVGASFDLGAGTVSVAAAAFGTGWTQLGAAIVPAGNGFYRCIISFQCPATTTAKIVANLLNGTTQSYTGDGSSALSMWGAQIINLGALTRGGPYLATVAAAVTSTSGQFTLTPPVTTDQDFILWGTFTCGGQTGGSPFQLDDGTLGNRITLGHQSNLLPVIQINSAGVSIYSGVIPSTPYGTRMTLLIRRRGGAWTFAIMRAGDAAPTFLAETLAPFLAAVTRFIVGGGTLGAANGPVEFVGLELGTFDNTFITALLLAA